MRKKSMKALFIIILIFISGVSSLHSQSYSVTLDPIQNGRIQLNPELSSDGEFPAGTVVTVTATPDAGFVLDAGYYSVPGRWGAMYTEFARSQFDITIDKDKHIGASFIEKTAVDHIDVTHDVVYAKPGIKTLKYDVYSPKGAKNLPIIVIIHGGGWVSNCEDVMRGLARELTKDGKFVVFSIDYRWAETKDGDEFGNTMADIIGDVYGAIAHIMEHAAEYGGDPRRIGVTGDSAGGHLSAAAINMADKIGKGGFGQTPGVFEFMPVYLPENKTVEQVRNEIMSSILAAAPSYGVFGGGLLNHYSTDPAADSTWTEAISPINNIPNVNEREVPQYLIRGTQDPLIKDPDVKAYVDALVKAKQRVEYVQVGGASHAFFDWKPDDRTKSTFYQYGVYYAAEMKAFFVSLLY